MNKLDSKVKKLIFIFLGIILFIILIIFIAFIIGKTKNRTLSYGGIEDKMVEAAEKYYSKNLDLLPLNETDEVEISDTILSENGYMNSLSKYQKDQNVSCSGKVIVNKSGSYYNYFPYLNCGDKYTTTYLYDKLLENVVSKDDGLYKTTQYSTKGGSENVYVYKGQYVNNYVKIGDNIWRIMKIDSNYNIMIIENTFTKNVGYNTAWDNSYNSTKEYNSGINDYYRSVIRHNLNLYYDALSLSIKKKIVLKDICIGPRSEKDTSKDGSIECKKTLSTDYLSLLTAYDFMNASLDSNCNTITSGSCTNYNYLLKDYGYSYWLMTTDSQTSYRGYKISSSIVSSSLTSSGRIRAVTNITKNTVYAGGSGTLSDPYLIK